MPEPFTNTAEPGWVPSHVFPWGSNRPTRPQRLLVALGVTALGVLCLALEVRRHEEYHSDFSPMWHAAQMALDGRDPYSLIGPGREIPLEWPLLYPATAVVVAVPFTLLTETGASFAFVALSTFLLAYGATRRSWHLLPMFASEAFSSSARLAQWSMLITAALFLPWLSALLAAKPQAGLAVIAVAPRRGLVAALIGSVVLLSLSLVLLPDWIPRWLALLESADHLRPPLLRPGGFLILLVLLRWRRPEAWLVVVLAAIPQTWGWYNVLILFTIAATFRETAALALLSTTAAIISPYFVANATELQSLYQVIGAVQVFSAYLPAALLILRRPNAGNPPCLIRAVLPRRHRGQTPGSA